MTSTTVWKPAPRCRIHRPAQPRTCPRCRLRQRTVQATRAAACRAGTWQYRIPAAPAAGRLRELHAAGMAYAAIADHTGYDRSFIHILARDGYTTVHPDVAAAIRSLTAPCAEAAATAGTMANLVNGAGTRRRLCGMAAQGHPFAALGARLGVSREAVHQYSRQLQVHSATAVKVAALAAELGDTTGTNTRIAERSLARGWVPLHRWEDIDDPAAVPRGDAAGYVDEAHVRLACRGGLPADRLTRAERVATISHLAAGHLTDRQIAERLQWTDQHGAPAIAAVADWRTRYRIGSGHRSAVPRCDPARVAAAVAGRLPVAELTRAERFDAVVALASRGLPDREIAERLRWGHDLVRAAGAVQTYRSSHRILPVQTPQTG